MINFLNGLNSVEIRKRKMKISLIIALAPERSPEIIESLKEVNYSKQDFNVIVVKGRNPSDNRNKGIEKSKGEITGFLDDDAKVDKELLNNVEEFFSLHPEIDIVGGPQLTPIDEKGFAKISGYALSSLFGAWKVVNRYSGKNLVLNADETMLTSANLFCRRNVVEKIKFNPDLFPGEDPDFISRAKKSGFKVAYSPNLIIYHKRRESLVRLAKQIYSYGSTRPKKESLLTTLKMPFFIVPSLFIIYLIFLFVYLASNAVITGSIIGFGNIKNISFLFLLPLFLYLILNLSFSVFNALSNKDFVAIWNLPYIYLIIHLSYGLGFLISTIENIFKRGE